MQLPHFLAVKAEPQLQLPKTVALVLLYIIKLEIKFSMELFDCL